VAAEPPSAVPASDWWIVLLQGIASLVIGILLITDPGMTVLVLVTFLGAYLFVTGIFEIVRVFIDSDMWGWHLFGGILGILAGLAVMRHPLWASLMLPATLTWLLGALGIVMGAVLVFNAFRGGGWAAGIGGVIAIVFGLLLLLGSTPLMSTTVLVWFAAAWALIGGVIAIIAAFRIRAA
jgi:uncharacterized membrane protein HdeD (DUF308 family)